MTRHIARAARWVLFSVFLTLGIVGLLLPVIPQVPFFIAAFVTIASESRWVRRKYVEWRRRHPRFFHPIERWRRERRERRLAKRLARTEAQSRRAAASGTPVKMLLVAAAALSGGGALAAEAVPLDPESALTIRTYREGWFSSLGHDHFFRAREVSGAVAWRQEPVEASSVTVSVRTASLEVRDPDVDEDDRAEIARGLREDVLEVARFPEIRFASTGVRVLERAGDGSLRVEVRGDLTVKAKTRPVAFAARVEPPSGGRPLRATGTIAVLQTDFGMEPVSIGLGAVKVKDRVELEFDVRAAR